MKVPVYRGLMYAKAKGLNAVPGSVLHVLRPETVVQRALYRIYRRAVTERQMPWKSYLFTLLGAPGWAAKKRLLQRAFFPSDSQVQLRLGEKAEGGGVFLRMIKPCRILLRSLYFVPRDLYRFLRGPEKSVRQGKQRS